jgi:hypothetical protein
MAGPVMALAKADIRSPATTATQARPAATSAMLSGLLTSRRAAAAGMTSKGRDEEEADDLHRDRRHQRDEQHEAELHLLHLDALGLGQFLMHRHGDEIAPQEAQHQQHRGTPGPDDRHVAQVTVRISPKSRSM